MVRQYSFKIMSVNLLFFLITLSFVSKSFISLNLLTMLIKGLNEKVPNFDRYTGVLGCFHVYQFVNVNLYFSDNDCTVFIGKSLLSTGHSFDP